MSPLTAEETNRILQSLSRVYLVGAGGCGVSCIGHLLLDKGCKIAGSDLAANDATQELIKRGADIQTGHEPSHLLGFSPALVVFSSAIPRDNAQLQAALDNKIPIVRRAVLLAGLLRQQSGICVAGMHGKTTTSALLAYALEKLDAHPSYAIGASVPQLTRPARWIQATNLQSRHFFVIEADESDGTLREYLPDYALLVNVDSEHLDYFPDLDAVCTEFSQLAQQTRQLVVYCADDPQLADAVAGINRKVSYGFSAAAQYRIKTAESGAAFRISCDGTELGTFSISLLGEKNILNAAGVIAMLHEIGYDSAEIDGAIRDFKGAARRQQELYCGDRFRVFDDYGHHPAEIEATIEAFRSLKPQRLLVAFQPHRFTRTEHLLQQFGACFKGADKLWLADIYAASEPAIPGVSSSRLADEIRKNGEAVEYIPEMDELRRAVLEELRPGDVVLFLGAGDITNAAHQFAAELRTMSSSQDLKAKLAARVSEKSLLRENEPLARRTTLRVGGPADLYIEPASENDLAESLRFCSENKLPFLILGRGSNLLVKDGGVRGLVICLTQSCFSELKIDGELMHCGAGVRLKAVSVEARRNGLTGMEFLEGIPGSLGGALRMNAGAMGSWIFDVVDTIRFMDYSGDVHERKASEVKVEYRGCPLFRDHIALGATLRGAKASVEAVSQRMNQFSHKRWESQPAAPSAGCIFKNPATVPAGKLIDELGLKGTRVGGAVVSDLHGNFIINEGRATAQDILHLIDIIKQRARAIRGIELETEVQIIGE